MRAERVIVDDGTGYLAERFTIAYAPSAGVYRAGLQAARPLGDRMVVVGIDDPGLPWVGYEVDAVATAWPDATVLRGRASAGSMRSTWRRTACSGRTTRRSRRSS